MDKHEGVAVRGKSGLRRRLVGVLVPMVNWYQDALGQSDLETFNEGMRRYRRERRKTGPDIRVPRLVLKTGLASPEMADTMLGYLREELTEAYADEKLTRENAPMIVRLDEWPDGHPMKRMADAGRASGWMSRPESMAELSQIILNSDKEHELYAAVGGGLALRDFMAGLRNGGRPKIGNIVVRSISDDYAGSLIELDLLPADFCKTRHDNIEWVKEKGSPHGKITVKEKPWKGRLLLHGMMYTDVVLYYGYWQLGPEGLSTVDGWLRRVSKDSKDEFEHYRDLFMGQ